jgi:deoxycytidylate deaminase
MPRCSRSETRPRSSHTFTIPPRIAQLQVCTGVHAHFPAVSAAARKQVNWSSFAANSLGETRTVTNKCTPHCREANVDKPTFNEKLYVLVYQCAKCNRPIVRTYWSKVFSKADVEATAFTVCCPENCNPPESLPGKRARYIAEVSWGPQNHRTFQLPIWV